MQSAPALVSLLAACAVLSLAPVPCNASGPRHDESLSGVRELSRSVHDARADVRVTLPAALVAQIRKQGGGLNEVWVEQLQRLWLARIGARADAPCDDQSEPSACPAPLPAQVRTVVLWAQAPRAVPAQGIRRGEFRPLNQLLTPTLPVPRRPWEGPVPASPASGTLVPQAPSEDGGGGLAGKHVYLSPGHGFTWNQTLDRWATQRGNTHDLVEDLLNAEAALHYLIPMLENAGARVVTMRERDLQSATAVVDDGDGKGANGAGYDETGSAAFQQGTNPGFGNGKAPYANDANPFALASYRAVPAVAGQATATARYVPQVPVTGRYAVYLGYTAGANRVPDAHVEVRHLGGVTHLRIDQTRHGQTWVYLGHFAFAAGVSEAKGAVLLHNDTQAGLANRYLIADVVRLGGGVGDIVRGTGNPPAAGPTSGRPRWEESCRTYAQFAGAPAAVYDSNTSDGNDDVTCRSRLAAWDHEADEDAIFLSWHTNAPSPARGTSTYVYGPNDPNGEYIFTGAKGSDAFGQLVQNIVVADIRKLWDPAWQDRGLLTAWFGEINPTHNPEMPSALIEAAFHSTLADANALREPRFRHLLARSLYKAIATYFANRDKLPLHLLPEPPQAVSLVHTATGQALLSWQPGASGGALGDAAESYLVQTSSDGLGFDAGTAVQQTHLTVTLPNGAVPVFARVVAVNAGGRSLPSATVGAVEGCAGGRRALTVAAFTRLDAGMAPWDDLGIFGLGLVQRLRQDHMNTFDYSVLQVQALAAAGLGVDSAERGAVAGLDLGGYALLDWAAGEQDASEGVLDAAERLQLTDWLQGGTGRTLWLHGAEVARTLDAEGGAGGGDWLETWFGARYAADDADSYGFQPTADAGGIQGAWTFDDGSHQTYDVQAADVLVAKGAGVPVFAYAGGSQVAAVRKDLPGGSRTLLMGVPLESVWPQTARLDLVTQLVHATVAQDPCAAIANPDPEPDAGDTVSEADQIGDSAVADTGGDDAAIADVQVADTELDSATGDAAQPTDLQADTADVGAAAPPADPGCGCRAGGRPTPVTPGTWGLALLLALWTLRRRKA